jgi:hypothetical protein
MGSMNNAMSEFHTELNFLDRLLAVHESFLFMLENYKDNQWHLLALAAGSTVIDVSASLVSLSRVRTLKVEVSLLFFFYCILIVV